jgi:hypothetical protein
MERTAHADWSLLVRFLPEGWEEQARALGAFGRARRIQSPGDLLRLLLIHVAVGLSLQRVAEVAQATGLAQMSKISVWERVRKARSWLQWMVGRMLQLRVPPPELAGYRVRVVDATTVTGPKQRVHARLHYGLELGSYALSDLVITDERSAEGLEHFAAGPNHLLMGDRMYARAQGIRAVKVAGGDVLVRVGQTSLTLYDAQQQPIQRLEWLRTLAGYEPGERPARVRDADGQWIEGRLLGLRLSEAQAAKARERGQRRAARRGQRMRPATEELAGYLCLFTTAPAERLPLPAVCELYRARWQIEIAFKRLKSLLHADQLRDTSWESAGSWLLAKMLYALLLHAYLDEAGAFSPWGYPLPGAYPHAHRGMGAYPTDTLGG